MFSSPKCHDLALLLARLIVAAIFLYAAYGKIMFWSPLPEGMAMSSGMVNLMKFLSIVEALGGVALIVGFLTCWASAGLAIIMVGAIYVMQTQMQIGFATATGAGWNFPLSVLSTCLLLMSFGAGSWSVDRMMKKV